MCVSGLTCCARASAGTRRYGSMGEARRDDSCVKQDIAEDHTGLRTPGNKLFAGQRRFHRAIADACKGLGEALDAYFDARVGTAEHLAQFTFTAGPAVPHRFNQGFWGARVGTGFNTRAPGSGKAGFSSRSNCSTPARTS